MLKTTNSDDLSKLYLENMMRDAHSLNTVSHPNVVTLRDVKKTKSAYYLFMDYCNGGTLHGLVQKRRKDSLLSTKEVHYLVKQLVHAFCELDKHGIVHRDLKPKNIMIDFPRYPEKRGKHKVFASQLTKEHFCDLEAAGAVLKIVDFGHSATIVNELELS